MGEHQKTPEQAYSEHQEMAEGPETRGAGAQTAGNGGETHIQVEAGPSLEELQAQLVEARADLQSQRNDVLRARAELDNLRKRTQRDVEQAHKYALDGFARELLSVRDSLELGLSAAQETTGDVEKLREGMELTLKQLTTVMERFNIVQVNPQGERFDPERHQAMSTQPSTQLPPGTVTTVYQKGYLLNERLIRPALVVVSAADPEQEAEADDGG
jgi:molecular chaperone GrpE